MNYKEVKIENQAFNFAQTEEVGERKFVAFNNSTAQEIYFVENVDAQNLKK